MATFDLTSQPWIPVVTGGARAEVSLLDALGSAGDIDGLAVDDPLQAVAVFRQVLLPVVIDALGLPATGPEWAERFRSGTLDAGRIGGYLARHAERFDLFHPRTPFAQAGGLRAASGTRPVSLLSPAVATGNSVPLFSARTESDPPPLTPAQAARAVLAAHCWDTAAIKTGAIGDPRASAGKTTGNPVGCLGTLGIVIPTGRSLAETLMLNVPVSRQGLRPDDRPQWRAAPAGPAWSARPAAGLLDLLTWQSRRILLVPEETADGLIVARRVVLAAGDRLDQIPADLEPHTAWRQADKPKAGQPPQAPVRHQSGCAAWRGLPSLLAIREPTAARISAPAALARLADLRADDLLPAGLLLQVLVAGVEYGNQSAVIENVISDTMPLPVAALTAEGPVRELLLAIAGQADELRVALDHLDGDVRRAQGADPLPWDRSQHPGDVLLHALTPVVTRLLAGLSREPDKVNEADLAWRAEARRRTLALAETILDSAPPAAFLGHTATRGGRERTHRLATAESGFRAALHRILGPPQDPAAGRGRNEPLGARA